MTMRQQALFWVGVLAAIFLTLYLLSPVLLPFVLGIILAYLLNPVVTRLERIRVRRTVGALLVSGIIILVFALALSFVVPFLANEIANLITSLPEIIRNLLSKHPADEVCARLGISRVTLWRKMKHLTGLPVAP